MLQYNLRMEPKFVKFFGLYLLYQLSTVFDKSDVGLYRDNRLAALIMKMFRSLIELGKILLHY